MAKKGMQIKYKSKKRERNKNNVEVNKIDSVKSFSKTLIGVIIFLGVMYLCAFGMQKLGVFEAGYTTPSKEETKSSIESDIASNQNTLNDIVNGKDDRISNAQNDFLRVVKVNVWMIRRHVSQKVRRRIFVEHRI